MSETWDEEKISALAEVAKSQGRDKWEGEDEDDDVKDNWDDEDEEPTSESLTGDVPKPKPAAPNRKNKLAQKIAEKEAKAMAMRKPMTAEEEIAEKMLQQKLQEEADLNMGREAFGIAEGGSGTGLDALPLMTKEDFEQFKKSLVTRLHAAEKNPHYVTFLENSFRDICASLEPDDIKRLSSALNSLFNEKVKAQKAPAKKKGKSKGAGLKMERTAMDMDDTYADDFDDFM